LEKESMFDPMEIDLLKELGNIGLGNATVSLSQMLKNEKIKMTVPEVSLASLGEVPELVGGPEKPVAAVFSKASGDFSICLIFLMPVESARGIIKALTEYKTCDFCTYGCSVIREVGNIVGASFLNALSFLTGFTFKPTPPVLAVDMAGAILGTIFAETGYSEDFILLIKTAFNTEVTNIEGYLIIIPDLEGIKKIIDILGLEISP